MAKLYWLFDNYRVTGAVFQVPQASGAAASVSFVDAGLRRP
jgi:hypothetical protein